MKRKIFCIVAAVLSLFMSFYFTGCVDNSNKNPIVTREIDPNNENYIAEGKPISGKIQIELYPEKAPNSVAYFLDFVAKGIYNKFPVSKVMHGGVVQFGDPWMSKQIRTEIDGEFKANGFDKNDIVFKRGTVALETSNSRILSSIPYCFIYSLTFSIDIIFSSFFFIPTYCNADSGISQGNLKDIFSI